jgi:hypothetical protein
MAVHPRRITRCARAVAALLIAPGLARAASPSDQARAEALFTEGRRLLAASHLAEACPKFAESQRLDPAIGTQLNLGDCYEKTGRTASAWAVFRDAAAEARRGGDARRATVAEARATALARSLTRLTILVPAASQAPGLEVKRDGVAIDRAAWDAPTPMDPGWHAVEATAPGKRPWTLPVTIDAAEPTTSTSTSTTITVPPLDDLATPTTTVDSATPGRSQRLAAAIVGGAGAATLGVSAIFTGLAVAKNHDSRAHCHVNTCDEIGVDLRDGALDDAAASTAFAVVGLAAIAGGAALWLTAPTRPKQRPTTGLVIVAAPLIGAEQLGVTLRGAF